MEEFIKERKLPNYTPFDIDGKYKINQTNINIEGIEIYFPYKIYQNQIKYMENIIRLLNDKINNKIKGIAGLESPTGTGKTLCLLCSTLAWVNEMRRQKKYGGKILYATRTHSQITQIIHELKKTCYRPKTAILSSRDNSCVNHNIRQNSSGTILNIKCRKFCKKCPYYNGIDSDKREKVNMMDIEDLYKYGEKFNFCPFYQQIEIAKNYSDIVFMPYNYIFDEDINNIMGIDIENNIIIIDEAHNVRKVCEDSKSVEIKDNDFNDIISDLDNLINFDENQDKIENYFKSEKSKKKKNPLNEISKEDIYSEKKAILGIQSKFNNPEIKIDKKGKKLTFFEFFDIFINKEENKKNKKCQKKIKHKDDELSCDSNSPNISDNINISNMKDHIIFLNKINLAFQDYFEKGSKISILLKIFNIISQLINDIDLQKSYNFFMENEERKQYNKESSDIEIDFKRKFNIFCFSPKIEFLDILKDNPFSIILTSGTLSPFKIFEDELQIKFNTTLENEHIVPKEQFKFIIVSKYSENGVFRFDYNNRNNYEMKCALGKEIYNYCQKTQYGGILVFFPSYIYLNQCITIWNNNGISRQIEEFKKIYVDSSREKNLVNLIKKDINKNYIFFSVFRGSSSEGIDFSDDYARMVICVGIPFADITDNRIKLKIEYMNNMNKEKKDLIGGNEWYVADAMTAVNQSLGRVIRHINDYGVMVCIDERYKFFEKYFSFWIREHYENNKNSSNHNLNNFFNKQRDKFKDIIKNNKELYMQKELNKSGFNSIINIKNNLISNINDKNIDKENNEKIDTFKRENNNKGFEKMDIILPEENFDNNQNSNNNIKANMNKGNSIQIYELPKIDEENINIINVKEIGYKTNHNEILNSLLSKKTLGEHRKKKSNEKNLIFEKWSLSKDNKINYIFDIEQKKSIELLESINEFINTNPKEFNKILNKYK